MRTVHNKLIVAFHTDHLKKINLGGIQIIRPDMWFDKELEDGTSQYKSNENKLLTHPQIVSVIAGNSRYMKGDKLFVHYMAKEWEEKITIDERELSIIDADYVLFKIKPDRSYELVEDTFLGDRIFEKELKLESGIFLNVTEQVQASRIKITHVPDKCIDELSDIKVGDIVLTVDDNQYVLEVDENTKHVKLTSEEIYAIIE